MMKRILKVVAAILLLVLTLMIIVPLIYKDEVIDRVKKELNNNLNATVELGDVNLSMFRDFPNLYVEINDIVVLGKDEFENDTLASLNRFYTGMDVASAFSGEAFEVGSIVLERAKVSARVLKDGKANWDIVKGEQNTTQEDDSEGEVSDFKIKFEQISIQKLSLVYDDASLNTRIGVDELDVSLSGDFSAKETNLNLQTTFEGVDIEYQKIKYLKKAHMGLEAVIGADLENMIFTFKDNQLSLNELEFGVDGHLGMKEEGYDMDLKLKARKTDFKTLLSMVPDVFKTDLKGLETSGDIAMNAFAKGEYREDHLPSFGASMKVENGRIKYPDLPESVEDIFFDVEVHNPGGKADNTVTDVNRFEVKIANNPFQAQMHIKTPVTDPQISGICKGIVDFGSLKNAIPMDSVKISGIVTADVSFDGKMSSIEKERYQDFMAKGDVKLTGFEFETPSFPKGVKIVNSVLSFTPKFISLNSFDSRVGSSDLKLKGKIRNYIPYALKGQTLYGDFSMVSNLMDLNEFMSQTDDSADVESGDTITMSVIGIPSNLDLKLVSTLRKVRFDKMDIENVNGVIRVKNSVAQLHDLKMNLLQGDMKMNGSYNVKDTLKPSMDFGLDVNDFDIKSAYNSLSMVKELMPIAVNCEGKVSAHLDIASLLDAQMNPVMNTLNGKGSFHSRQVIISENKAFDALAQLLKNDQYKRISITQFDMAFLIKDGNVEVPPFNAKVAGHQATIYGTQSVDGNLDFTMDMKVPKDELGHEVNRYFDKLPGYDKVLELDVAVKVKGTVSEPIVKLDLSKAIKQAQKAVAKELERRAKKELKKKGDDLKKELEKKLKKWFK